MSLQSLAETLVPLADASATQPRSKLHSPFSPLVGWLATWWSSEGHESAGTGRSLVPDPDLFISPVFHYPELSNHTPPAVPHSTDSPGIALCNGNEDEDGSEIRIPLSPPRKDGLTKEEFEYVVNSLLKFLEEAELVSSESGCEEYKCYAPEKTEHRLRHGLWSPRSTFYLMQASEDEDNSSVAETLELGDTYSRDSLELLRTSARVVPVHADLSDDNDEYPYRFEFEFEGGDSDSESVDW